MTYNELKASLPKSVSLLAVSKKQSHEAILELYALGQRLFAENRLEELLEKQAALPKDISWQFVGNLQRKKVAKLLPYVDLIHSVDSLVLAQKISDLSTHKMPVLLQCNTSGEIQKQGFSPEVLVKQAAQLFELPGLKIVGLMTMAPQTEDHARIRHCFRELARLKALLERSFSYPLVELSMGMSADYSIAIEEGATIVRIGSKLFN